MQTVQAPDELDKKTMEADIMHHFKWCKVHRIADAGRYGVQGSYREGKWQPIQSLPDFEGIIFGQARQFITDAKVCSQASFPAMNETHASKRQVEHMLDRSEAGAVCFFTVHFNKRELAKKTDPAFTVAIPVRRDHELWRQLLSGEKKSISRHEAAIYGHEIRWVIPQGARKPVPDVVGFVQFAVKRLPEYALSGSRIAAQTVLNQEPTASAIEPVLSDW